MLYSDNMLLKAAAVLGRCGGHIWQAPGLVVKQPCQACRGRLRGALHRLASSWQQLWVPCWLELHSATSCLAARSNHEPAHSSCHTLCFCILIN